MLHVHRTADMNIMLSRSDTLNGSAECSQAGDLISNNNPGANEDIEMKPLQHDVERSVVTDSIERTEKQKSCGSRKWWVLACGFWSCFLADGFIFHLSIFFLEIQNEFHKSKAETALVQSVASGTFHIGGIFAGVLTTRFGIFNSGLLGAALECIGLFISSFATSIPFLVLSLGLLTGFGTSVTYVFATTNIGFHWTGNNRLIALSIAHLGAGAGAVTFPFVIDILSRVYGWRGALLILSAITSHIFVFAISSKRQIGNRLKDKGNMIAITDVTEGESAICEDKYSEEKPISLTETTLSILRDKIFMTYIVLSSVSQALCIIGLIIFVDYFQYKGFDRSSALFSYFIMSLSSIVARPLPGMLKKIPHVSVLDIQASVTAIGACAQVLLPAVSVFSAHIALTCMLGILLGGGVCLVSVCTMKLLGKKRFAIGSGMSLTLSGILIIAGGPLAGLVRDLTGKYDWVYYGGGVCLFISSGLCFVLSFIRKLRLRQSRL